MMGSERDGGSDGGVGRWIREEALRSYNRPPETPTEEIWDAVERRRRARRDPGEGAGPGPDRSRGRWTRPFEGGWAGWGLAVAAALVVGLALGRFSAEPGASGPAGATGESAGERASDGDLYRVATDGHLTRAEALLTSLRTGDAPADVDPDLGRWAGELLAETRLYLDSPAAADPGTRALLEDLELVLVQVAVADRAGPGGAGDRERAREAMEERDLLLRLRNATPPVPTTYGS